MRNARGGRHMQHTAAGAVGRFVEITNANVGDSCFRHRAKRQQNDKKLSRGQVLVQPREKKRSNATASFPNPYTTIETDKTHRSKLDLNLKRPSQSSATPAPPSSHIPAPAPAAAGNANTCRSSLTMCTNPSRNPQALATSGE